MHVMGSYVLWVHTCHDVRESSTDSCGLPLLFGINSVLFVSCVSFSLWTKQPLSENCDWSSSGICLEIETDREACILEMTPGHLGPQASSELVVLLRRRHKVRFPHCVGEVQNQKEKTYTGSFFLLALYRDSPSPPIPYYLCSLGCSQTRACAPQLLCLQIRRSSVRAIQAAFSFCSGARGKHRGADRDSVHCVSASAQRDRAWSECRRCRGSAKVPDVGRAAIC